jgi:hypothetical protein
MTEPAKWSTNTTTRDDGTTTVARRLANGPDGISVTLWRSIIEGTPHDSVVVRVDTCTEPGATDMQAAYACRQIAARLLEAADSIALGAANPGGGTAARGDDHAVGRGSLATATPGRDAIAEWALASVKRAQAVLEAAGLTLTMNMIGDVGVCKGVTPERQWCPDCGPDTGTNPECDLCGDAATNNEKE